MACSSWPGWHGELDRSWGTLRRPRNPAGWLWGERGGLQAGENCLALLELPNADYKEMLGSQKLLAMGLEISCYLWLIWVYLEDQRPLCPCVFLLSHTKHNLGDKMPATSQYLSRLLVEIRNRFWKSGEFQAKMSGQRWKCLVGNAHLCQQELEMFALETLVQELPPLCPNLPPLTLTVPPSLVWAVILGLWGSAKMLCKSTKWRHADLSVGSTARSIQIQPSWEQSKEVNSCWKLHTAPFVSTHFSCLIGTSRVVG